MKRLRIKDWALQIEVRSSRFCRMILQLNALNRVPQKGENRRSSRCSKDSDSGQSSHTQIWWGTPPSRCAPLIRGVLDPLMGGRGFLYLWQWVWSPPKRRDPTPSAGFGLWDRSREKSLLCAKRCIWRLLMWSPLNCCRKKIKVLGRQNE